MNKKMMAIFMSALMVVAATFIVVASPSDAADNITEGSAKYIIGSKDNPLITTYDATGVTGSIKFNESIFTNAVVKFGYKINQGYEYFQLGAPVNNIVDGISLTISKNVVGDDTTGKHTVNIVGSNDKNVTLNTIIEVTVTSYLCENADGTHQHENNCINLGTQNLYYGINAKILATNQTIVLGGWTNTHEFEFEKNVDFTASVSGDTSNEDYKFYAKGLPKGISMRVDGKIGGMLSNDETEKNGTATVYATTKGNVFSNDFEWRIVKKDSLGIDFTMEVNDEGVQDNGYFIVKKGEGNAGGVKLKLNSVNSANSSPEYKVVGKTIITPNDDGTYTILGNNLDGAGTIKVTVTAKGKDGYGNVNTISKSFTVYVVGSIVDADLSPTVTSK